VSPRTFFRNWLIWVQRAIMGGRACLEAAGDLGRVRAAGRGQADRQ